MTELSDDGEARQRPDTMMWCGTCEEWILKSRRQEHAPLNQKKPAPEVDVSDEWPDYSDDSDDSDDDEPTVAGHVYQIRKTYSVTLTQYVPALTEAQALEKVKYDMPQGMWPDNASGIHETFTETSIDEDIMSDDPRVEDHNLLE
jgi:hypothetical protein